MDEEERTLYENVTAYFEDHLSSDGMPYWDLIFTDGSDQPRDSSALAAAACGMLEYGKKARGLEMLRTLKDLASTEYEADPEGPAAPRRLCVHGGKGVDEPDLWGDYFYMKRSAEYATRSGSLTGKIRKMHGILWFLQNV